MIGYKKFIKKEEDFSCENCGFFVCGNGFTNHCPQCLWSKHVDIFPGDRMEICGGMMKPITVSKKDGDNYLAYRCESCGFRRNKKITDAELAIFTSLFSI